MCLNYKLNTAVTTAGCWPGLAGSYRHNRKMLNYIVRWPILRIHIYYLHYLHILSTRFHFWLIPVFSLLKFTQLSHLTVLFHLSWCRAQTRQTAAVSRQHSEMWTLVSRSCPVPVSSLQNIIYIAHCTQALGKYFHNPVSSPKSDGKTWMTRYFQGCKNIIVRMKKPDEEKRPEHEVWSRAHSGHWSSIRNTRAELIVILCILVSISPAAQLPPGRGCVVNNSSE